MFQIETISAKMLDYYVERSDAVIIDLRDPAAYRRGHVRNAVNIPYRELEEYLEKKQDQKYRFPKDKLLIFYCDRGGASMQAARSLARQGCRTRSVIGGFAAYREILCADKKSGQYQIRLRMHICNKSCILKEIMIM